MARNIKILAKDGAHYDGKMYKEGATVVMPDNVADAFKAAGVGEIQSDEPATGSLVDVVNPVVPNADPLNAARLGSLKVDDHPGLVAHADATGAPKRSARVAPDAVTVADTLPDPNKPTKPKS